MIGVSFLCFFNANDSRIIEDKIGKASLPNTVYILELIIDRLRCRVQDSGSQIPLICCSQR